MRAALLITPLIALGVGCQSDPPKEPPSGSTQNQTTQNETSQNETSQSGKSQTSASRSTPVRSRIPGAKSGELGGPCGKAIGVSCKAGLICMSDGNARTNHCERRGTLHRSCTEDGKCDPPLLCISQALSGTIGAAASCRKPGEMGTPCDPKADKPCLGFLLCEKAKGASDTRCAAPKAGEENGTCHGVAGIPCKAGLSCVHEGASSIGRCVRDGAPGTRCDRAKRKCDSGLKCVFNPPAAKLGSCKKP